MKIRCSLVALVLFPVVAIAETLPEMIAQAEANHLDIAISGAQFSLSLTVSGSDIFGDQDVTTDHRSKVAIAVSNLSRPFDLFQTPREAGCVATSANVTLAGAGLGRGAMADQAEKAAVGQGFHANYAINCRNIDAVQHIRFTYFDRFPNAEKLMVKVMGTGTNLLQEVTRDSPMLDFTATHGL